MMTNVVRNKINGSLVQLKYAMEEKKEKIVEMFDNVLVRFDVWWVILLAVLMVLSWLIANALAIWCVWYKGKRFTGGWGWSWYGVKVVAECK